MANSDSKGPDDSKENPQPESNLNHELEPSLGLSALDLGLGSFLNTNQTSDILEPLKESIPTSENQEVKTETTLSEYERLANNGDWKTILEKTESFLERQSARQNSSQKWIEAQAWWILSQLELKSLPLGVLIAPFEAMLDHYLNLNHSSEEDFENQQLESLVKKTSAKVANEYFSSDHIQAGMQIISRARVLGGDLTPFHNLLDTFSSKLDNLTGSEERFYNILRKEVGLSPRTKISHEIPDFKKDSSEIVSTKVAEKKSSFGFLVFVIFLLILILLTLAYIFSKGTSETQQFPYQVKNIDIPAPQLEVPKPKPIEKVDELDQVLYGLGEKGSSNVAAVNSQAIPQPSARPTQRPKVELNTNGPLESDVVREMREKQANKNTQANNSRGLDVPGPAIAPRFESFPQPKIYRVKRASNLMVKPSLNSEAVAGLNKGDLVKAVGMAGYWLKILSKQGNIAYILIEDADPY